MEAALMLLSHFRYSSTAKMLGKLVHNSITKLQQIGLCVNAIICDQGSNNRSYLEKEEKISRERP